METMRRRFPGLLVAVIAIAFSVSLADPSPAARPGRNAPSNGLALVSEGPSLGSAAPASWGPSPTSGTTPTLADPNTCQSYHPSIMNVAVRRA